MVRRLLAVAAALVVLALPRPAEAWGFEAHKFIMDRAISLLPPQIRGFFEANRTALVEHSIDPDLWRTAGWQGEGERHFVDMDAYGPPPFKELSRDFEEAVKKHGREFVEKNGTLPWRTEEFYRKLVDAFGMKTPYARENVRFLSSVVSHYVGDAHVPFHAALNYDGQLTQQWGIHARFEADLFERYRTRLRLVPKAPVKVANIRDYVFDTLHESYAFVLPVLEADRHAVGTRELYDDGYYTTFFGRVRPVLEKRLADSITAVASVIMSAWDEAGRPSIPPQAPRTPRKVRRK